MAVIFADGFDWYVTADLGKKWTGLGNGSTVGPTYSRLPSGQGLLVTNTGNSALTGTCAYKSFGTNYTQGLVGFAFNSGAATLISRTLMVIGDGTTEQISVRTNGSSVVVVNRGATLLATGTTVLSSNTWYYFELKFSIHASAGTVLLNLNGAAEIDGSHGTYVTGTSTTQNTRATANTQWNAFGIGNSAAQFQFDDIYALDTSTGSNTTFLGPIRVVALSASASGNYSQWTPNGGTNYGCINEPYEDGDTSFNQSSTANQIDTFTLQDLPASSGSVFAIQTNIVARTTGTNTLAPLLRISATDYVGTTVSLSSSYQFLSQIYDLQPVGGTPAWDTSTVASLEAGYKLIS